MGSRGLKFFARISSLLRKWHRSSHGSHIAAILVKLSIRTLSYRILSCTEYLRPLVIVKTPFC